MPFCGGLIKPEPNPKDNGLVSEMAVRRLIDAASAMADLHPEAKGKWERLADKLSKHPPLELMGVEVSLSRKSKKKGKKK